MIGIDVGGANLKVVSGERVHVYYCPLWDQAPLRELLLPHAGDQDAAVVMSGELADCFSSKADGIAFIVSQVRSVFPHARFYGMDGRFHQDPVPALAAANWLVMADLLKDRYPDALLIDIGSTTTDIIPLNSFKTMIGQTDLTRLQQGYLVYSGLLRTPAATLVSSVRVNGRDTPVSSEYFASTGDAFVVAGTIPAVLFTAETADRKGVDALSCMRRLARVVCADLEEIGEDGAREIAFSLIAALKNRVSMAAREASRRHHTSRIVTAGIGSGIVADWLDGIDLSEELGDYAHALPAWAAREVAARTG